MTELTPRQTQVARLIAQGYTDKQIAAALGISIRRVSKIIAAISCRWGLARALDIRVQIAQRAA